MSEIENRTRILVEYHRKHPNRLHQFLHKEMQGIDTCPICNVNLRVFQEESQNLGIVGIKRLQWNSETKRVLLQTLGGKCNCCGETREEVLEIDHIIPLSWCGTNDIGNLQILCSNCHLKRHKGSTKDFVVVNDIQPEQTEELRSNTRESYMSAEMVTLCVQLCWKYRKLLFRDMVLIFENDNVVAIVDPVTKQKLYASLPTTESPPMGPCMELHHNE